ncbi:MAG: RNA polymerase factor sigma-54 [Caldimicrobium sp.]
MVEIKNQLKLLPQVILTPQLKLVLKVLQLNILELKEYLLEEIQSNPFLEIEFNDTDETSYRAASSQKEVALLEERSWDEIYAKEPKGLLFLLEEREEDVGFDARLKSEENLKEHLLWQLGFLELTPGEREIAMFVIGNLNEKGYLGATVKEIAEDLKVSEDKVQKVRKLLMKLDPVGIAAQDLKECLLTQLEFLGLTSEDLAYKLVEKHLEEIPEGPENLSKKYGYSIEELKKSLEIIRNLEPYPARNFYLPKDIYFEPDLRFYKEEGQWKVEILKEKYPKVFYSPLYYKFHQNRKLFNDGKAKQFLKEKLKFAEYLLKALDSRYTTLYKVGSAILEVQKEFLEKGQAFLKPLTLKDLSELTGLHESTISRVISHKYVETPIGTFPLKFFFSTGFNSSTGESISATAVKNYIKEIIFQEPPKKPYSDNEIAKILHKKYGIKIARRTVTKYREELNIPSLKERKNKKGGYL